MKQVETDFSQFANFKGDFGPPLLRNLAAADVAFGPGAVTAGKTIPISAILTVPVGSESPQEDPYQTINLDVSVTITSVSANSFSFDTNPGHVLYPASITFSATDVGNGQVTFSIQVNGDFADFASHAMYIAGGSDLEDKIWNSLTGNVQKLCSSNHPE